MSINNLGTALYKIGKNTTLSGDLLGIRIKWKINKFFALLLEDDYVLESPSFPLAESEWNLHMCPSKLESTTVPYVGLFLEKRNKHKNCHVLYSFAIKKTDGSYLKCLKGNNIFTEKQSRYGCYEFYEKSELIKCKDIVSPDGSLTVFCTVRIGDNMEVLCEILQPDGMTALSESLKDLFMSTDFSDVTISVNGTEFPAHRSILAARSEVFASMFKLDMSEKKTGRVEIEDCEVDSFEKFLLYLYTGNYDDIPDNYAVNLYKIADKYNITELKTECVPRMAITLSVDSFFDVINLASIHNEAGLMTVAQDFFINHARSILLTSNWINFAVENPLLAKELFLKYIDQYE